MLVAQGSAECNVVDVNELFIVVSPLLSMFNLTKVERERMIDIFI